MTAKDELLDAMSIADRHTESGLRVAARLIDVYPKHATSAERRLAALIAAGMRWLRREPACLVAQGDPDDGPLTALVCCAGGPSLIAAVVAGDRNSSRACCELFGNRGVLCWEANHWLLWESSSYRVSEDVPGELLLWVRESLASGRFASCGTATIPADTDESPRANGTSAGVREIPRCQRAPLPPPYGVLLVAGDHTHQPGYAQAFASDPRCRLVGVTDERDVSSERMERNRRFAQRLGIPLLPDLEEALGRADVNIVSVCAEPERRASVIIKAALAHKHLYLDKPLCASVEEAEAIVRAVREANVLAQMMTMLHWEPAQRIERLVASGQLGPLRSIHCELCFAKGHGGTADLASLRRESGIPGRFESDDAKRELTNVGVYCAALLVKLLGRRARRVAACTGNYFFAEHQRRDMEDFGQVLLEFDGDVTATITAGRTGWRSHPAGGLDRVMLIGSNNSALLDAHRPRWDAWCDVDPWVPPPQDPLDPMGMWIPAPDSPFRPKPKTHWLPDWTPSWSADVTPFLDCIECGSETAFPIEYAAAATEILLAAYRSAAHREIVDLPLPN